MIDLEPSPTATAGQAFAVQPVIYEEDQFHHLETGDDSSVITASIAAGAGPLRGTTQVTVSGGVATFTDLADDAAGTISLDFRIGSSSVDSGPSDVIAISPAAASQFIIQNQPSTSTVAGQAFGVQPVIDEEDAYGNPETNDSTTVIAATLASGRGPLLGTLTATVIGGVATFTDLADDTAGTITLKFTGGGLASAPSDSIAINPAAASQLVIVTLPSATASAGTALAIPPVVDEEDRYGNLETGDDSTVITASPSTGSPQFVGATATVSGGVATLTGLTIDTAGTIALEFSGGGLNAGPSNSITISPGPASQLVIHVEPSTTASAGQALATQPVVYEEDRFGNIETGDDSTVITASPSAGPGRLSGAAATVSGGVATFTGLSADTAGTGTLQFKGGGLTSAATNSITVSPAAAASSSFTPSPPRRPRPARRSPLSPSSMKKIPTETWRQATTAR